MPTPGTLANGLPAGIGNPAEATQATAWVRQQPWYQDFLKQYGVVEGPNQQVKLNDQQRAALMATMLKNGIGLNSKYDSVDENGMIAEEHHKLKKAAIAAAIGGLALTGFGAAGIGPLAGALGGASAAGAGGAAAAEAAIPTTMGIAGAGALGLPVTAGLGTLGTAAAATAAGAGALAPLVGTSTVPATGALVPATTSSLGAAGSSIAAGGSTLSKAAGLLNKGTEASDILGAAGKGIGDASSAAGNNRLTAADLALKVQQVGNQTQSVNTQGQSAFESELLARSKDEEAQRQDALKNIYRASYAQNRTPGPYNARGLTPYSPEYLAALKNLQEQGSSKLANPAQYDSNAQPTLKPYDPMTPLDPKAFMDQYGQPSTLEQVGNWLSPTLSTLGKVAKYF